MHLTEICGSIAGDNTIFIAVHEGVNMADFIKKLKRMAK